MECSRLQLFLGTSEQRQREYLLIYGEMDTALVVQIKFLEFLNRFRKVVEILHLNDTVVAFRFLFAICCYQMTDQQSGTITTYWETYQKVRSACPLNLKLTSLCGRRETRRSCASRKGFQG